MVEQNGGSLTDLTVCLIAVVEKGFAHFNNILQTRDISSGASRALTYHASANKTFSARLTKSIFTTKNTYYKSDFVINYINAYSKNTCLIQICVPIHTVNSPYTFVPLIKYLFCHDINISQSKKNFIYTNIYHLRTINKFGFKRQYRFLAHRTIHSYNISFINMSSAQNLIKIHEQTCIQILYEFE